MDAAEYYFYVNWPPLFSIEAPWLPDESISCGLIVSTDL